MPVGASLPTFPLPLSPLNKGIAVMFLAQKIPLPGSQ